jgi:hypothetical protein
VLSLKHVKLNPTLALLVAQLLVAQLLVAQLSVVQKHLVAEKQPVAAASFP